MEWIPGTRLKSLRDQHLLKQRDMAERLDVSQAFISAVETGAKGLPREIAQRLIDEFGLPDSFFSHEIPEIEHVNFRMAPEVTTTERNLVQAIFNEAQVLAQSLLDRVDYPMFVEPTTAGKPEDAARDVRHFLGFGDSDPIPSMTQAAERLGVGVIHQLIGKDRRISLELMTDGLCAQHQTRPLIVSVKAQPTDRLRFTIAHEVAHLVMDQHVARKRGPKQIEKEAHEFAAALLLPLKVAKACINEQTTIEDLLVIKREYGISVQASIHRAKNCGVISVARHRELLKELEARGWSRQEPDEPQAESPRLLGMAAGRAFGLGAYDYLVNTYGIKEERLRHWLGDIEGLGLGAPLPERVAA
ncbi:XRE family transcriptional regulator [Stomatohabitans albus]|uniref:XRE family transcriptional regulator n=1 Tax=Stomatohabitans albus TaxID=3110766 RepID=UPI00300D6A5D